jgi:probable FeS assembly SUF system protein SufT
MNKTQEIIKLNREVIATLVPFGTCVTLPKNTEVTLMYELGGTYTITVPGAMYRLEGKDADALGKTNTNSALTEEDDDANLEDKIWRLLKTCYDPEVPVNIVDLGLIYNVDIESDEFDKNKYNVTIYMTVTSPGCRMGPIIAQDAKTKIASLDEVNFVDIRIIFDPPWDRSMMSDQAKLDLGFF